MARTSRVKDPNAPKRPLSGYMLWLGANRDRIKKSTKEGKVTEVTKLAGIEWKQLSEQAKEEWQKQAAEAKKKYDVDLKIYQAKSDAQ
ncbi:FACT complex subunit SSRP1-like protein [Aphelenchoides avenae]|nr:FACT complex subunit SSRP1-like protein [Aphelenchus avenae]